jgi:uncharacterized lipoprotein YmbA
MQKKIPGLLLIIFLVSCAMPETRIYNLQMPAVKKMPAAATETTAAIVVTSPRYLAQPYVASRTSPYQLAISRYAKWDSPPDEIVRDAFRSSLAAALFRDVRTSGHVPTGAYSLSITLQRFERSDEGALSFAEFAFDVTLLSPEGKNLYESSIAKRIQLEDRSYASLAKGLSSALGAGTEEVRDSIAKALKR